MILVGLKLYTSKFYANTSGTGIIRYDNDFGTQYSSLFKKDNSKAYKLFCMQCENYFI